MVLKGFGNHLILDKTCEKLSSNFTHQHLITHTNSTIIGHLKKNTIILLGGPPSSPENQNGLKRKSKQRLLYANFGGQTKGILVFLKVAYNISKNADKLILQNN